jgi:hypothetical protein
MSQPEIADIAIPDSELCRATTDYARRVSDPYLFNHVMRTYAFGALAGARHLRPYDTELLYVGCLLHDLGLCDHVPVKDRFEVDGADAAKQFLSEQGMDDRRIDIVWDAIALHTTYAVPQRKQPEIALVQLGAAIDVGVAPLDLILPDALEQILDTWPRLGFKQAIVDAMLHQMRRDPRSAASPVVTDIAERHLHGFRRPNIADAIAGAAFAE